MGRAAARAATRDAALAQAFEAERRLAFIRVLVVLSGTILYPLMDPEGTIPWMAWSLLVAAWGYSLGTVVLEPYRRFAVLRSSYFLSATDSVFTVLWLAATGGFASPFFVVIYVGIVAVAFRFPPIQTVYATAAYGGTYAAMVAVLGQWKGNEVDLAVRLVYCAFAGLLGAAVSQTVRTETQRHHEAARQVLDLRRHDDMLHDLVEAVPQGIFVLDHQRRVLLANREASTMFGFPAGHPPSSLDEVFAASSHANLPQLVASLRRTSGLAPTAVPLELSGRRADGRQFPIELILAPFRTETQAFVLATMRDLSGVRSMDARLRASQEGLRQAQTVARLGNWEWDLKADHVEWSEELYRLFGLDPSHGPLTYADFLSRVHPEDRGMVDRTVRSSAQTLAPYEFDHRVVWPDGTVRWLQGRGKVEAGSNGKPIRMFGTAQDITGRKEVEVSRAETERRFELLGEHASDLILLLDGTLTIRYASAAGRTLLGYEPAEMAGHSILDFVRPEHRDQALARLRPADGADQQRCLVRFQRKGGGIAWLDTIYRFGREAPGGVVKEIVGIARDASDAVLRDQESALLNELTRLVTEAPTLEQAIARSLEFLCQTMEFDLAELWAPGPSPSILSPRQVWHKDAPGLARVAEEGRRLQTKAGTGLASKVWDTGKSVLAHGPFDEKDWARHEALRQASAKWAALIPIQVDGEPLGVMLLLSCHGEPPERDLWQERVATLSGVGRKLGYFLRRKEEQHRKAELDRLQEQDRFRGQFINSAAHELRTPLTPIRLQVHLLQTLAGPDLKPEQRKGLEILARNVDRLNELVNDVLDGARLQAGRLRLAKKVVNVNQLVREAAESFQEPARLAGLALHWTGEAAVHVEGDAIRLSQVLFNLLGNAVKFTPAGGRIEIRSSAVGNLAVIRVHDTGIGLSSSQIARLFQPFTQLHEDILPNHRGTGLGLFISRGIVELHGGRLRCESQGAGAGATFVVELPRIERTLVSAPSAAPAAIYSNPARRRVPQRIRDLV